MKRALVILAGFLATVVVHIPTAVGAASEDDAVGVTLPAAAAWGVLPQRPCLGHLHRWSIYNTNGRLSIAMRDATGRVVAVDSRDVVFVSPTTTKALLGTASTPPG